MVLLVADRGPLRTAIERELSQSTEGAVLARSTDTDLFQRALGQRAIIYVVSASLLEGKLDPEPSTARVGRILSASTAPGVRILVAVVPCGGGFEPEIMAIRRFGTPYVIVEGPPLFEELAEVIAADDPKTIWLPAQGHAAMTFAHAVARETRVAIDTEQQGRVVPVTAEALGPVASVRRAAASRALRTRVHRLWLWAYRLAGRIRKRMKSAPPRYRVLLERLFPELGSPSRAPRLPRE
jgi:hypothetical protein